MSEHIGPEAGMLTILEAAGLTEVDWTQHKNRALLSPQRWLRDLLISRGWTPPPGQ